VKLISIVTPCLNEEENVVDLYEQIKSEMSKLRGIKYEHIFIDNASTDGTVAKIKALAARDRNVKLIVNVRNFGHIRSPFYAMLQARGDAVVVMASDLQDPPSLLPEFVRNWQAGFKVVIGVKEKSRESPLFFFLRSVYYRLLKKLSEVELIEHYTGFGLYDRQVIETIRGLDEQYPYFRGLIAELGYERVEIKYAQPRRQRGITKNNFYTLYDMAMLGITQHSKIPLRLAAMLGFATALLSLLIALVYLVYKLIFWSSFTLGLAPLVVGLFFFGSVQLFFLGVVGEYVGAIYTRNVKRPLVIEKERINF
jgi:glycosyltransferase involved in cell wall biosynthesis